LQHLEKCCNALSRNMLTLTFVWPIDLVSPLNINCSFYNPIIIKQNNMTYQHKVIFCIRDGFEYGFWVGTYIPVTRPILVFWNRGKPKPYQNPVKTWKTRQIRFGLGGQPRVCVLLPCLVLAPSLMWAHFVRCLFT